jgi:single-strand DNA-binding protein
MADFNQAILLGNLTRDPELRTTPNGQTVATFGMATNRRWTDKAGEKQEAVEFHTVVVWSKLAEIAGQILYKGRKALVVGRLQTRSWEGQDGVKRSTTEIVASELSALGPGKGGAASGEGQAASAGSVDQSTGQATAGEENQAASAPGPKKSAPKPSTDAKADDINLDDIPF